MFGSRDAAFAFCSVVKAGGWFYAFALIFFGRAPVEQNPVGIIKAGQHSVSIDAPGFIGGEDGVTCGRDLGLFCCERAVIQYPTGTASIENFYPCVSPQNASPRFALSQSDSFQGQCMAPGM